MQIEKLKQSIIERNVIWTNHVRKRMEQRRISKDEIIHCVLHGEVVEDYPNSYPYPSCLILGKMYGKSIHVVVGHDDEKMYVITVYVPDETKFESDFRIRRVE